MSKRAMEHWRDQIREDYNGAEEVAEALIAAEDERIKRDKRPAKFCPVCGKRPEYGFEKAGRHIYNGHCEKCGVSFVIHINS